MLIRQTSLGQNAISAILNCICPECGGVIELETNQLECLECGKQWRHAWERNRARLANKAKRSSSARS